MNPDDAVSDPKERQIFLAALEKGAPSERVAYLEAACQGDAALRQRLEALLGGLDTAGTFLEKPVISLADGHRSGRELAQCEAKAPVQLGERIDRYKILELIGEGGCGVVYVAEQQEPIQRRVALKLIKLGMDTNCVVARFEAERQALALMDHPNIAKVLDAGATATGRPYFVMELVRGLKLTDYCRQNDLSIRERLRLFVQVCQAIQHAHQKGIIHRDIKPSNILVTLHDGIPVPKVIDFGIAKATSNQRLADNTIYTQFQQFLGTPAYMSPEQAELSGLDIDTRADIYSLGVLLYELLTGATPFDPTELISSGIDEMRKTIREKEPVRPSTKLNQTQRECRITNAQSEIQRPKSKIDEDLDWIVMKCLEKDRSRRYQTANGLAMDLQRHLGHEPVLARPPSRLYRMQQMVRRNRVTAAATVSVGLALVAGAVVSALQASRAAKSELEARRARYAAEMSLAFEAWNSGNFGSTRQLLDRQRPPATMDLRGWEWRHLFHQTRGDERMTLAGHSNQITAALFLNDGRTVVSAGRDDTLRFWDVLQHTNVHTLALPSGWHDLDLSSDGLWLAVTGDRWWRVYDVSGKRWLCQSASTLEFRAVAISPSNNQLALGAAKEILVVDFKSGETVANVQRRDDAGSGIEKLGLTFSPDGRSLAYGRMDGTIGLTNFLSGAFLSMRSSGAVLCLAFAEGGRWLISGGEGGLELWDSSTGNLVKSLGSHHEGVTCVSVCPNGAFLASGGFDQSIRIWDTQSWSEVGVFQGHRSAITTLDFSPDGEQLVSGGTDEEVRVWDMRRLPNRTFGFHSIDDSPFSWPFPAGDRIVLVHGNLPYAPAGIAAHSRQNLQPLGLGGAVSYLDCFTLQESSPEPTPPSFSAARVMAFGPGAASVALGHDDGRIEWWSTQPFRRIRIIRESGSPPVHLSFAENGRQLSVHNSDDVVEIRDLNTGALQRRFPPITNLFAGPNCQFWARDHVLTRMSLGPPPVIEVWELAGNKRHVYELSKGDPWLWAVSHNGQWLATSAFDGALRLWDIGRERLVATIAGQFKHYDGLVFSPDDSRLVAGGYDGTITIWDLKNFQQVAHWKAHVRGCVWLQFVAGDQALVSLGDYKDFDRWQGEIRVWHAPRLDEIDELATKSVIPR